MQTNASQIPSSLMSLLPIGKEQDPLEVLAKVVEVIQPNCVGVVKFQGVPWRAQCFYNISLEPGILVEVVDRHKNTLIVMPTHLHRGYFALTA
jgi:membrane-bound ClpP family serine protease